MTLPWQDKTASLPWAKPERSIDETVRLLQADVSYIVANTAVVIHATGPHAAALSMLVNTRRGQQIPTGTGRYTKGHTVTFQDVGMPQPGAPEMSVAELCRRLNEIATELGLELE